MPKVLVHSEGSAEVLLHDLGPEETAAELLGSVNAEVEEYAVWIGEDEDPIDPGTTLATLEAVTEGVEITVARTSDIHVTVIYNGEKGRDFQPQQKVRRVFEWAVGKNGFNIPADQRPEHELAVEGHEEAADPKAPVSSFANTERKVRFTLRRKDGFQGE
jgi:hypothetical protein